MNIRFMVNKKGYQNRELLFCVKSQRKNILAGSFLKKKLPIFSIVLYNVVT